MALNLNYKPNKLVDITTLTEDCLLYTSDAADE